MIAAEWQILFHSFQGKDIDIQILDGYTEQMPLLARGLRATAGTPRLWGQREKTKWKGTHTGTGQRLSANQNPRSLRQILFSTLIKGHLCAVSSQSSSQKCPCLTLTLLGNAQVSRTGSKNATASPGENISTLHSMIPADPGPKALASLLPSGILNAYLWTGRSTRKLFHKKATQE